MTSPITYSRQPPVGLLWMERGPHAYSAQESLAKEACATLAKLSKDRAIDVALLAYADAKPVAPAKSKAKAARISLPTRKIGPDSIRLLDVVRRFPKPVILRVHGENELFAMALASACDVVIAAVDASFSPALGATDKAQAHLVATIANTLGSRQCRRYLLTEEIMSAAEAYRLDLVHELAVPNELDGKINEILGHIVKGEAKRHTWAKQIIDAARANEARFHPSESPARQSGRLTRNR